MEQRKDLEDQIIWEASSFICVDNIYVHMWDKARLYALCVTMSLNRKCSIVVRSYWSVSIAGLVVRNPH